ncbi:MAG: hypothetical protein DRJ56_02265, partial [Thermoprotei archaeon]
MGRGLLEELFREYYRRNASRVRAPSRLEAREFGFILFNRQGMVRHLSFGSEAELREYLRRQAPAHAYYSSAYYERPSAPTMDEKGWLGADLVFDIDVDHIETECKELHDSWRCLDCGLTGRGMCPAKCPRCGGERFEREVWVCDLCVEAAKEEALKVCDVLLDEFGLSEDEIKLAFSGHRGFHIHVESEVVMGLEQDA